MTFPKLNDVDPVDTFADYQGYDAEEIFFEDDLPEPPSHPEPQPQATGITQCDREWIAQMVQIAVQSSIPAVPVQPTPPAQPRRGLFGRTPKPTAPQSTPAQSVGASRPKSEKPRHILLTKKQEEEVVVPTTEELHAELLEQVSQIKGNKLATMAGQIAIFLLGIVFGVILAGSY